MNQLYVYHVNKYLDRQFDITLTMRENDKLYFVLPVQKRYESDTFDENVEWLLITLLSIILGFFIYIVPIIITYKIIIMAIIVNLYLSVMEYNDNIWNEWDQYD